MAQDREIGGKAGLPAVIERRKASRPKLESSDPRLLGQMIASARQQPEPGSPEAAYARTRQSSVVRMPPGYRSTVIA